eukprot:TRINITY_DN15995_c0_g1_i3.p1 TRINITY_DN15995_c0_g1~~TRINITY_DN15995_c0_g1_i3.p1  ORF type:complete len:1015 (-),score=158.32 TRINITY_DN15995_c0_g1_i3:575-3619(-)
MALTLREALRSLCCNNSWIYAIFWKLRPLDRMVLTWEDGYCDYSKNPGIPSISCVAAPNSALNRLDGLDTQNIYANGSSENLDRSFMAEMLQEIHILGEGIIGNVAFTGKHQWIFQESYTTEAASFAALNGCSNAEYPRSWRIQFAAGIKTIAVVAAAPYGVIQLGSRQTIAENLELVLHIKALFGNLQRVVGSLSSNSGSEVVSKKLFSTHTAADISSRAELLSLIGNYSKNQMSKSYDKGEGSTPFAGSKGSVLAEEATVILEPNSFTTSTFPNQISPTQKTPVQPYDSSTLENKGLYQNFSVLSDARASMSSTDLEGQKIGGVDESYMPYILGEENRVPQITQKDETKDSKLPQNEQTHSVQEAASSPTYRLSGDNSEGNLRCPGFVSSNAEGTIGVEVFDPKPSFVTELKQPDKHQRFPAFQNSNAFVKQLVECNVSRESGNVQGSMGGAKFSQKDPVFPSVNIEARASDTRQLSQTIWPEMTGQFDTPLETNNSFIPSQGGDLLMPSILEPRSWDKEITQDVSTFFQDYFLDGLCTPKDPLKALGMGSGDVLPVVDECDPNVSNEFERYLKSLIKGHENFSSSQSLSAVDASYGVSGTAGRNVQAYSDWGDMQLQSGNICPDLSASAFDASVSSLSSVPTTNAAFHGSLISEKKSENMLDAVIANMHAPSVTQNPLNHVSSRIAGSVSNCIPQFNVSANADLKMMDSEQKFLGLPQSINNALNTPAQRCPIMPQFEGERSVKQLLHDSSSGNRFSSWVEDSHSKCENQRTPQVKKVDEPTKANRKRAKPGESTRPRPKDRQQIQDRVKELREIVPNGTKCSIDALLERTIKHMLFLQSVTKHAEKLKQSSEPKSMSKNGSLGMKENLGGGASWALELGGQTMERPIIVENMSQPRQLLVEMLCEERGLFLEIADIIRRLGLTILKGVMEAREDKIWAHFVVEANRDVHRVEILWSLMQLLQQNSKNNSSQTNTQPSVITHQANDAGSQTFGCFQKNPAPHAISMAERLQ